MKKLFITWGFVAAALTLFSCAKQETAIKDAQPAQAGVPFELVAGVDTKTATTDASTINWVANDALNVFVAEHNSEFGANKQFTTADGTSTFSGVLESALDGAKTYDWKVFYPYNEDILTVNTHDGAKGYLTLGSKTNATQTQAGNNNKAHLAGAHMPLYGIGNGVAGDGTPNISLSQVMSVVAVKVTNKTDSPLVVSSVDFTAPAGTLITGTFFLDFSGNTPVFESSGVSYTSNVAKLTVTDGVAIAKNGSADFYIAVKPFTVSSGTITVAVNGEKKDKTISSETVFAAGKIKTINYDYVETVAKLPFEIDGTAGSAAYSTEKGLSASGLGSNYAAGNSPYLTKFDTTGDYIQIHYDVPAGKVSFGVKMLGGATTSSMKLSGSADGASFTDIETFSISGSQNDVINFTSSNAIDASYRFLRLTFTKGSNIGFGPFSVALPSTDPVISVTSDNPMAVTNANDLYAIEYTIVNPIGGKSISAATNVDWITNFDYKTAGEVAFEVAAQASGAPARSGNITLSYDGADNVVVTVNQAAGAGGPKTSTLIFTAKCNGSGTADDSVSWTVTSDGTESNFDSTKGIHYGTSSAQVGYIQLSTSGISGTITKVVVNASTANGVTAGVSVTVGGAAFGGAAKSLTSDAADYTFNGSASGAIVVNVAKPEKAAKALYVKSITVTYTP